MKNLCMIVAVAWSLLSVERCLAIDCPDHAEPTSCGWCCIWPWCDKCDWTEVGTQSGADYKNYTPTDCTGKCAPASGSSVTCNYGFTYAIGQIRWTWSSGLDIPLAGYATFKATYTSPTNSTTITYFCNGTETLTNGQCGSKHYNSLRWDYTQKAYKQRVYSWYKSPAQGDPPDGYPYCETIYYNPQICSPCVGSIATGEEVSGCDSTERTVMIVPAMLTNACDL